MPRRLTVTPHRSSDERRRRVGATPAAERVRWLAVRPAAEGRPSTDGGPPVGLSPDGVCAPGRRAHGGGPVALADDRRGNPGAGIPFDALQRNELRAVQGDRAVGSGSWTSRVVAAWVGERVGRPVAEQRRWEMMRRLGFTPWSVPPWRRLRLPGGAPEGRAAAPRRPLAWPRPVRAPIPGITASARRDALEDLRAGGLAAVLPKPRSPAALRTRREWVLDGTDPPLDAEP